MISADISKEIEINYGGATPNRVHPDILNVPFDATLSIR